MKKDGIIIQIYPRANTWKERWTVIFSTLFGWPYLYRRNKNKWTI